MTTVLYAIPGSHPCAAVELALQLKRIPYRRVELIPVVSRVVQRVRFGARSVPGVRFGDGECTIGSRAILRELDARVADPPLLPADAALRARVERAEEWGDQVLQPLVRRVIWAALRRAPASMQSYSEGARLGVPAPLARLVSPPLAHVAQRLNGATDPAVQADLIALPAHLDRVDGWIADGTIGGERPNAADLQIGAGLRLLLTVEDVRPRLDERPAGALARRWFPSFAGSAPAGTLPAAWLRPR